MFEVQTVNGAEVRGGALLIAFPSVGMVGTIAGSYIADALKMTKLGYVVSDDLPPAALVQEGIPGYPLRIVTHGKISLLTSEFQMPLALSGQLARTILDWSQKGGFDTIVCLEGLLSGTDVDPEKEVRVFGVGSTEKSREALTKAGIEQLKSGMITGVSGALLSEGELKQREVVCLLADANAMYPDARGAAKLIESLTRLLPSVDIDLKELYEEAARIEENVRAAVERTKEMLATRQSQAERLGKSYMYG